MTLPKPFLERIGEVTNFCVQHAGKCFGGWPRETLFLYVGFHALAGSIFVVRRNGNIAAVGFAWPCQPERASDPFEFKRVPAGDALLVREVIGTREACREMFAKARAQWPHIKRFFAYRHRDNKPELFEFGLSTMERFCA